MKVSGELDAVSKEPVDFVQCRKDGSCGGIHHHELVSQSVEAVLERGKFGSKAVAERQAIMV